MNNPRSALIQQERGKIVALFLSTPKPKKLIQTQTNITTQQLNQQSIMFEQPNKTKTPATAHLVAFVDSDQYVDLVLDVTGAFVFRDRLKALGFQFVRDRSAALAEAAPLDRDGKRKHTAAWRRVLVAVPPSVSSEQAVSGVKKAVNELEKILSDVLEGSKVKGGKSAALTLQRQWPQVDGIDEIVSKLTDMDTPWVEDGSETKIHRPAFVA